MISIGRKMNNHLPPISDHSSPEETPSVRSALSDSSPLDMIMSSSCQASVTGMEAHVVVPDELP
jgi:hypothetical protein